MKTITFDIETTIAMRHGRDGEYTHSSYPWHGAVPVLVGWTEEDDTQPGVAGYRSATSASTLIQVITKHVDDGEDVLLVGHNLAFDLAHLMWAGMRTEVYRKCFLWDTQVVAYLLSAQTEMFPALYDTALKNGIEMDAYPAVEEIFKRGLGADHVPHDVLGRYLSEDVLVTRQLYSAQLKDVQEEKMEPLVSVIMESVKATINMTINGMHVDTRKVGELSAKYIKMKVEAEDDMLHVIDEHILHPHTKKIEPTSSSFLKAFLWGGTVRGAYSIVSTDRYKTGPKAGMFKTKNMDIHMAGVLPSADAPRTEKGNITVDDDVLRSVLPKVAHIPDAKMLVEAHLKHREANKILSTYLYPATELMDTAGFVHPQYNQCATATGRLSSSNPNMQNQPNGFVKSIYVPAQGRYVQVDFKQLEIVELANLSKDPTLVGDILHGRDIHNELHKMLYKRPLDPKDRKEFKRRSFLLIYGGGPQAIADQCGISLTDAKDFVNTFFKRYPVVREWQQSMILTVTNGRFVGKLRENGYPVAESYWTSGSGRMYHFREYKNKYGVYSFSPTQVKNYPVQGGATGDKVPLFLGTIFQRLAGMKSVMVNTTHDSVLFDCPVDEVDAVIRLCHDTADEMQDMWKNIFGEELSCPLRVEAEVGTDWSFI